MADLLVAGVVVAGVTRLACLCMVPRVMLLQLCDAVSCDSVCSTTTTTTTMCNNASPTMGSYNDDPIDWKPWKALLADEKVRAAVCAQPKHF